MELIDKEKVVAEIEKWRHGIRIGIGAIPLTGRERADSAFEYEILGRIKDYIDTLEVKEVDLEKEIELVKGDYEQVDVAWNNDFDFIARHFFELGIKAKDGNESVKSAPQSVYLCILLHDDGCFKAIVGCFATREDAETYSGYRKDIVIQELKVGKYEKDNSKTREGDRCSSADHREMEEQ